MKTNPLAPTFAALAMALLCAASAAPVQAEGPAHEAALTRGWDIFDVPLAEGKVKWSVGPVQDGQRRFQVTFQLKGAQPEHSYTVGAHFFEPKGKSVKEVKQFGGWEVGHERGVLSREGVSVVGVGGWDFGILTTDKSGDAVGRYEFLIPAEDYFMQFTVRAGRCRPAEGVTDGCAAVFRTGGRVGGRFEAITGKGDRP